jgi:hypothetical protein
VYLPVINRTQPLLAPLAADDAWMDTLQAQWEAEGAAAAVGGSASEERPGSDVLTAEGRVAAEALTAARQFVQTAFDRSA